MGEGTTTGAPTDDSDDAVEPTASGDMPAYGEDDDQDYVDRSKLDFDPADGLYTGTAVTGESEIPDVEGAASDGDDGAADDGTDAGPTTDSGDAPAPAAAVEGDPDEPASDAPAPSPGDDGPPPGGVDEQPGPSDDDAAAEPDPDRPLPYPHDGVGPDES